MTTGCLLITNNIDLAQEEVFNAWYQSEHLNDRLGIAGFLTARRYIAIDGAQRYAAIYETRSPDVLTSPTYAALLRAPSPATRAIMPHFRDMTRVIGRVAHKAEQGCAGMAAIVFIQKPDATDADAVRIGAIAAAVSPGGAPPEAVRVIVAVPDSVGVDTPESKIRPTADRRADVMLVVEWLQADTHDVARLHAALAAQGWQVENDRGGLYRLLSARHNKETQ